MSSYHKDLTSPAFIEIKDGLKNGHQITVWGKVSCNNRFAINFQKDQTGCSDIAFHFNPRNDQTTVVRNSFVNGCWQTEERDDLCTFPFEHGQEFKVHIVVTSECYFVYVNDVFYLKYNHRINHHEMEYLRLTEGATYHEVEIREQTRVPYNRCLPALSSGMCIHVRGLIHECANRFSINLMRGPDISNADIALHVNPRQDQNDTVLNTRTNGCWGVEERGFSYFPFTKGEFFDISILVHCDRYIVTANGQPLHEYVIRGNLCDVGYLNVMGDCDLMSVTVFDQLLNDWVKPIPGGLQTDDLITVEGFFKPCVDRFQVNLLTGDSCSSERAIHVNPRRGQNEVVMNNTVNGCWQTEVKYPLPAYLHHAVPFVMDIINKCNGFHVFLDGKKVGEFPHRLPVADIQSIFCSEDAYFHHIRVHHKLPHPLATPTATTPVPGDWLSVVGYPPCDSVRFAIDYKTGSDTAETVCNDIPFHYNPRFSQVVTVRNTLESGYWGSEERSEDSYPFSTNEMFEINVLITSCDYKVVANGKHHIDYAHRIAIDRINHVITRLDADFYCKDFY